MVNEAAENGSLICRIVDSCTYIFQRQMHIFLQSNEIAGEFMKNHLFSFPDQNVLWLLNHSKSSPVSWIFLPSGIKRKPESGHYSKLSQQLRFDNIVLSDPNDAISQANTKPVDWRVGQLR